MTLSAKFALLLLMLLCTACARLKPSVLACGKRRAPRIAMRDGVNATFRKPRGTGLVVGIEFKLDLPGAPEAATADAEPQMARLSPGPTRAAVR